MLDIFSNTAMAAQIEGAQRYRDAVLAGGRWLAWCSGNHDFHHGDDTPMDEASPEWMRAGNGPRFVRDGETRVIGAESDSVVVSTLPWPVTGSTVFVSGTPVQYLDHLNALLHRGARFRAERSLPWIVLHHEPPIETAIAAEYDAREAAFSRQILSAAKPDFSLHGHIHDAPNQPSGSWIDRVGSTICFNAGQSLPGELPNAILLEIHSAQAWTAEWYVSGVFTEKLNSDEFYG